MRTRTRYWTSLGVAAVVGGLVTFGLGAASDGPAADLRSTPGPQPEAAAPEAQATLTPPQGPAPGPTAEATDLPPPIKVVVDGRTFTMPAVVPAIIDVDNAQFVASVNGRSYLAAPDTRSGDPCFIEVPDSPGPDPVIGCDQADQLEAKGGWLIYHDGTQANTRSGVLILSSRVQATSATAGSRPLLLSGRAVIFENLPKSIAQIDVAATSGEVHVAFS